MTASWCSHRCPPRWEGAAQKVFDAIDPAKDVDGFHPVNVGRLVQGRAHLMPCTPVGVMEMLDRSAIRDCRRARRGDRPQRDRRKADGHVAASARRDRHDLPFQDAGPRRRGGEADILVSAIGRPGSSRRHSSRLGPPSSTSVSPP